MIGIISCTKECNLRCKYCFEESNFKSGHTASVSRINDDFCRGMSAFKRFGAELVAYNRSRGLRTEFTFHGGEPLLIQPEFIEELCKYYLEFDSNVLFNTQTNGTVCNDALLDVLKKYRFRVGVSMDGAAPFHDENRVFPNGMGSHKYVLRNLKLMKNAGIQVGAMATITASITNDARSFYEFFAENGLDIGFNACYNSPNSTHPENQIDDVAYSKFLKDLFDLWIGDEERFINIQPFERILRTMVTKTKDMQVCQFIQDCREVNVSIDTEGDIYRCQHYINLPGSKLGNIMREDLETIMAKLLSQPAHWDRMKAGKCGGCEIQHYCFGGCPYWQDAKELTGLEGDFNCKSQKFIVHYIYNYLKKRFD